MKKVTETAVKALSRLLPPGCVTENYLLSGCTSFRIGGPTTLVCPKNAEMLKQVIRFVKDEELPWFIGGNGTNLLCADGGFDGIYIQTLGISEITVSENQIRAEGGALLSKTATTAMKAGLKGMAPLHGIPGTVGGGVAMNAGAYGGEMKDVVSETCCLLPDGTERLLVGTEHRFGYRQSAVTEIPGTVVLSSTLSLEPGDPAQIAEEMKDYMQRRKTSQPLELPSAGSVFKRPAGHFVGAMVQECGLKGYRIGGAAVSEKHGGFIVNLGGATASDVRRLIEYVRETVLAAYGVLLVCEIRPLGFETGEL